ncbi:MAG TPA: response regulator [Anaerolineales bacterium]|nr:response regulator [Anaerolineales bacterium]
MAEKILIVDDDIDTLRLVGLMLQRQGYEISAASNGIQALAMVQAEHPDLILLDLMMPDIDGVEVTRRLRSADDTKDVPIIMFTAKTQVEDKIEGFEAGADDYLTKPTQPRELFVHVKAVLARTNKTKKTGPIGMPKGDRGYVVGVLAARGGLGVSTLVLNLGVALAQRYKKDVILGEFRPGQGIISLELGQTRADGLTHLLQLDPTAIDRRALDSELVSHSTGVRLLLASPQPRDAKYMNRPEVYEAIARQLAYMTRYLLLDLGSSLTPMVEQVVGLCNEIMVIVEPVPQTVLQTKALIEDLIDKGVPSDNVTTILVNRVRSGMQLSWSQVQDQLGRPVSMIFTPAPDLAYQASMKNIPMVLQQADSLTAQQFVKLAEKVAMKTN